MTSPPTKPFPFLELPLELRESIYSLYFKPADRLVQSPSLQAKGFFGGVYNFDLDIWKVNKQIYAESRRVWKRENVFVKIATPWPSAGMYRVYLMATDGRELVEFEAVGSRLNHISSEGLVPIVCTDRRADAFTRHHALVQISAPFHQAVPEHTVIVLLDDLHLFTQTWYYSALSYPMLNDRLSTTFVLRNPYASENRVGEETGTEEISLSLQRRLLLPFEQVKGLYHMDISGYAPQVQEELERRMAIPVTPLQQCCENATDLMLQGDAALAANNAAEALNLYTKAFKAIHILIHGRTRRVLADVFFHEGITHGRYTGQTGMTVRVVLRLKLVSRTLASYLKLQQYGEAAYWGMRSIRIMREALDTEFEDFLSDFLGDSDVGLIYIRTAIAFMKMEDAPEKWGGEVKGYVDEPIACSERLWTMAKRYVKQQNRGAVRKELQDYGVTQRTVRLFGEGESAKEGSVAAHDRSSEE